MFAQLFVGIVGQGRKVHAHRNGWAMCGSGRVTTTRRLQDGDDAKICKRCAKHLDQPVKDEADRYGRLAARSPYIITADSIARDIRESVTRAINEILWTDEEKALFAALRANMARFDDENRGVRRVPAPVFDDEDDFSWYRNPVRSR